MNINTTKKQSVRRRLRTLAVLVARPLKPIWRLPGMLASALKQRRRQAAVNAAEAERLDRIRNPSDYLGK